MPWNMKYEAGRVALVAAALAVVLNGASGLAASSEGIEFFEKKIRPVLVERCYKCHSATSEKLKGGLRLDSLQGLLKGGDTRPAIVPGDPEKSLLVEAIRYQNPDLQMPPKLKLPDATVSDFVEWIKLGAPWPEEIAQAGPAKVPVFDLQKRREEHWSWKPIQPVKPPEVRQSAWTATAVDRFILAKLEENGLNPAPPADQRTLVRRLSFDLTGLPPTPAEVEAFVSGTDSRAYEKLVDRLLAAPQFGERWARHWLDLVRYSETLGHEFDYPNFNAWRYRDYVIRAFNLDLPYNQFVMEQVAGDLLKEPRLNPSEGFNESAIGTGFFWLGQRLHSPVDVRQEQAEIVDNQIDVTAKTFLGLTVACARCHDHKFDAISTKDYYSLFGVMDGSRYTQRSIDPPETLAPKVDSLKVLKNRLRPLLAEVWLQQASNLAPYLVAAAQAGSGEAAGDSSNRLAAASDLRLDAATLGSWGRALQDKAISQPGHPMFAWSKLAPIGARAESADSQREWRETLRELAKSVPAAASDDGSEVFADFSGQDFAGWFPEDEAFGASPSRVGDFVVGDGQRPVRALLARPAANSASVSRRCEGVLRSPTFTIRQRYAHLLVAGSMSRLNIRVDNFTMIREPIYGGLKQLLEDESPHWITVDLDTWKGHRAYIELDDLVTPDPSDEADKKFGEMGYVTLSRVVFSDKAVPLGSVQTGQLISGAELARAESPEQLAALYQAATVSAIKAWSSNEVDSANGPAQIAWLDWLVRNSLLTGAGGNDPAAQQLSLTLAEFQKIERSIPERRRALAMVDGTGVDENVFIRGSHKTLGEVVPRRFLEALGGSNQTRFTRGSGRLELAQCLVDPANPFLARVMVNRVWHHLFGRGIVPTTDDFGFLGQRPSNPELLDWLANWFRTEGNWSTKKLIRLLVNSSTYRMSSKLDDRVAEEKDPGNVLLHRMPVRRLEGEAIRDAILAVSGRLDHEMFGPPVPVHLTEFMDGRGRPARSGPLDGAGRRSIYLEVRRNFPAPMMRTFDSPVPFTTIGTRTASSVPAQSLILMNDPFVIGQARIWARSVLSDPAASAEQRIRDMYQEIFCRPPDSRELADALAFLDRQGEAYALAPARRAGDEKLWADLGHVLMNVKEFVFLN
jgi:hypothetical protein